MENAQSPQNAKRNPQTKGKGKVQSAGEPHDLRKLTPLQQSMQAGMESETAEVNQESNPPVTTQDSSSIDPKDPIWQADFARTKRSKILAVVRKRLNRHPKTKSHFDASDIVQTSFRNFFLQVEKLDVPLEDPEGFLFQTMYWKLSDYIDRVYTEGRSPDKENRDERIQANLVAVGPSPSSAFGRTEEILQQRAKLQQALAELKPYERELFLRLIDEDIDLAVLAEELGIQKSSLLRKRLRIVQKLKKILGESN